MLMTGSRDGEHGSYPELVDALTTHGAQAEEDARQLYRRVVFNVLVSNVDDHLRNHGFLWSGQGGWVLTPAYDLNPTSGGCEGAKEKNSLRAESMRNKERQGKLGKPQPPGRAAYQGGDGVVKRG